MNTARTGNYWNYTRLLKDTSSEFIQTCCGEDYNVIVLPPGENISGNDLTNPIVSQDMKLPQTGATPNDLFYDGLGILPASETEEQRFSCNNITQHHSTLRATSDSVKAEIVSTRKSSRDRKKYVHFDATPVQPTIENRKLLKEADLKQKSTNDVDGNLNLTQDHRSGRPYLCHLCEKCFRTKPALHQHIGGVHAETREYGCGVCFKTFKTRNTLVSHMKQVHEEQKAFHCELCTSSFKIRTGLNQHMVHRHGKVKKYKCEECGKCFRTNQNLKLHVMQVHNEERNFQCHICSKAFKVKQALLQHIRRVHVAS